jgi:hypothetical protein
MKIVRILALTTTACLLMACSGHPGAGNWISSGEDHPGYLKEFFRLNVTFEGRTDIFGDKPVTQDSSDTSNGAIRRCFWRGVDAQTILMDCVQAANTDIEESYQLRVSADNEMAELIKDEIVVGRFMREKRTAE